MVRLCDCDAVVAGRLLQRLHDRLHDDDGEFTASNMDSFLRETLAADGDSSLLAYVRANFADHRNGDAVCKALALVAAIFESPLGFNVDRYVQDIVTVCLVVLRSACLAKVKEKCFMPLNCVVTRQHTSHVPTILDVLSKHIDARLEKPTVLAKEFELIGSICKMHPEFVGDRAETLGKCFVRLLEEYTGGKAKISFPLLEGCFLGLDGYLKHFFEPYMRDIIYKSIKMFSDPGDQYRRGHARAALLIIAHHSETISQSIYNDYKYWHCLLLKWINQMNPDDKKVAYVALFSFYTTIGNSIHAQGATVNSNNCLEYFMRYFKETLKEKLENDTDISLVSSTYEVKYALKGFTTLISKCRNLFKIEEYHDISKLITQRAILMYKHDIATSLSVEATDESTSRIEELCTHIEALVAIGINTDRNVESLVCILTSDYAKCKTHRRFIVKSALKESFKIIDLEIVIFHLIKESCKYCVTTLMDHEIDENQNYLSYRSFLPIWRDILEIGFSSSAISLKVYDVFISMVIKLLPQFNLSTKIVSKGQLLDNQENVPYMETMEVPENYNDYRFFINVCDLTASILSFTWTHEWFLKWIDPVFSLFINGRKQYPKTVGFLKIAEVALKILKSLNIFEKSSNPIYTDHIKSNIEDFFIGLSFDNNNDFFQLRVALVFLQIPPSLIDKFSIEKLIKAFKIIFRSGKNNLYLISSALEILEEWIVSVENDYFQPICRQVLPDINEYLCSSGIIYNTKPDSTTLWFDKKHYSNEQKTSITNELTSPQLASLQRRIIIFLSKVDSNSMESFLAMGHFGEDIEKSMEDKNTLFDEDKLTIKLPYYQQESLNLSLDSIFPRINELSLNSMNKETRLAACQTLHSLILITFGQSKATPVSQRKFFYGILNEMYTTMLHLSADSDENVSNMFSPLLKQACHWYAIPENSYSNETSKFISCLLKGSCHSSDPLIQDLSCQVLNEYIVWTKKKSTIEQLKNVPKSISDLITSVCRMLLYKNEFENRGSYLIINTIIAELYDFDSVVDEFILSILFHLVQSIESSIENIYTMLNDQNKNLSLASEVLEKTLSCLKKKIHIFQHCNTLRKVPQQLGTGTINDVAFWLLLQGKSKSCDVSQQCIHAFVYFCHELEYAKPHIFFDNLLKLHSSHENIFMWESIIFDDCTINDVSVLIGSFYSLYRSLNNYHMIINLNIMNINFMFQQDSYESVLLFKMKLYLQFVNKFHSSIFSDNFDYGLHSKEIFYNMFIQTLLKYLEIICAMSILENIIVKEFIADIIEDLLRLIATCISNPITATILYKAANISMKNDFENLIYTLLANAPEKSHSFYESIICCPSNEILQNTIFDDNTSITHIIASLDFIKKIVDKLDINKKRSIFSKYNFSTILDRITKKIFIERDNNLFVADLDSICLNKMTQVLQFISSVDEFAVLEKCLSIMMNNTQINNVVSDNRLRTCGTHFFNTFESVVLFSLLKNFTLSLDFISKNIQESNSNALIFLLEKILINSKIHIKPLNIDECAISVDIIMTFQNIWPKLLTWNTSFETLINIFSVLITNIPVFVKQKFSDENVLSVWLLDLFISENDFQRTSCIITLLPCILEPGIGDFWYNNRLINALNILRNRLPLSCYEFPLQSKDQSEYLNIIKCILKAISNSGSFIMMEFIIKLTVVDNNHLCEDQIVDAVNNFTKCLKNEDQLVVLKELDKYMVNNMLEACLLQNFIKRFFIPILSNCSPSIIEDYLACAISYIFMILNKKITNIMSHYQFDRIFVEWTAAYKMLDIMFLKVPFENIDSVSSKVATEYYKRTPAPQQFVKEIFTKALHIRKVEVPVGTLSPNSIEFLRLSHCAAFKCLYAITISKTKNDLKFYTILLNHKAGNCSNFWEGMIDVKKKYSFPIEVDQKLQVKSFNTPRKESITDNQNFINYSNTIDSLNIFNVFEKKSQELQTNNFFSQTIKENILKFDLNTVTIRNPNHPVIDNINFMKMSQESSLPLIDNDINRHECMAVICQIINDIDIIESQSHKEVSQEIPDWVKCITEILSDRNKEKNIRMFLAQVVDNTRDVFSKYAKILFSPLLSVIQDRCTSYSGNINYFDFCLISLLLSWDKIIIPESQLDISIANGILEFIVIEINVYSQSSFTYKHCLELLNNYLGIWGKSLALPYQEIIKKLEDSNQSKCGIQVAAVFLANNLLPFESPIYDKFIACVFSLFKSNEKHHYRPAAEVLGMILKQFFNLKENNDWYNECFLKLTEEIKMMCENIFGEKKYDRYIVCVYNIQKYYERICEESTLSKAIHLFPRFPTEYKKYCLNIVFHSLELTPMECIVKELNILELNELLNEKDLRVFVLHIFNKVLNILKLPEIDSLLKDISIICSLTLSNDRECRAIACEILMKLYSLYKPPISLDTLPKDLSLNRELSNRKRHIEENTFTLNELTNHLSCENSVLLKIKSFLIQCLNDKDEMLKKKVFDFWVTQFSTDDIHKRWNDVCLEFLFNSCTGDVQLIGFIVRIVLGVCEKSPDVFDNKIFENPLEDCTFCDYDWIKSNDIKSTTLKPQFAETLNSQLFIENIVSQTVQGHVPNHRDIETLNCISASLKKTFVKSEESLLLNSLNTFSDNFIQPYAKTMPIKRESAKRKQSPTVDGFTLSQMSSLDFSTKPELLDPKSYHRIQSQKSRDVKEDSEIISKLRKTFVMNKKEQIIKYSGISAEKKKRELLKKLPKIKIESYKKFKDGDYPDIQISTMDLYQPLMELISRDVSLAKTFIILLFKCLMNKIKDKGHEEHFNSFTIITILKYLKNPLNIGIDSYVVVGLLEVIRLSIQNCYDIEEFNDIIVKSAQSHDIEWLSTLILEEKEMYAKLNHEPSSKKLKASLLGYNNKKNNYYLDRIHKLKMLGNYMSVQKMYAEAIVDEDLDDDWKLHFTEGYFKCFSYMSDWDGLVEQLKYQLTDDTEIEAFDYNKLWKKVWIQNSILPLVFTAHVHRLASMSNDCNISALEKDIVLSDLQNFDSSLNNWMVDNEKNKFLTNNILPQFSIWKSIFVINENSLCLINQAMEWIRRKWMQGYIRSKYNLDHEDIAATLDYMQIESVGEISNILELPFFSGSISRYDVNSLCKCLSGICQIWNNCSPTLEGNLCMWDLRLACRSVLLTHLKTVVSNDVDDDENSLYNVFEKLKRSRKMNELSLIKQAINKNNYLVAEKLIKRRHRNLDSDEEISWSLEWAIVNKIKALSNPNPQDKLKLLLSAWKLSEEIRLTYSDDLGFGTNVSFLSNTACVSHEVYKIMKVKNDVLNDTSFTESIIEIVALGELFTESVSDSIINVQLMESTLVRYSEHYLMHAMSLIEKNMSTRTDKAYDFHTKKIISGVYLTMAKFYRNIIGDDDSSNHDSGLVNFVKSILRGIKYDSLEAKKLFPVLLIKLENLKVETEKEIIYRLFSDEIVDVPSYVFIPWVSQLLAHLPLLKELLTDVIYKIAIDYPQSIVHQYRSSRTMWKSNNNLDMDDIIKRLDSKLLNTDMETFIKALSCICDPGVLLKTHLNNILKNAEKNGICGWNESFEHLFEDVFSDETFNSADANIRGLLFKELLSHRTFLNNTWKKVENAESLNKGCHAIMKFLKETSFDYSGIVKKYRSIKEFSPYLYNFSGNDTNPVHVFGLYGKFETSPVADRVSIYKFDSEVLIIGSLRRPVRVRVIGSDGRKYNFLIKRGEDLRQDQRIQQLFGLMNDHLIKDGMKINTYKVTPLSHDLGVIEWLMHHATIKDIFSQRDTQTESLLISIKKEVIGKILSLSANTLSEKYGMVAAHYQEFEPFHESILKKVPPYLLRDCLCKLSLTPDNFIYMRNNFVKSLAPMNISHWILGIGDRHLSNCLISLNRGSVVGIDFGYAFGMATQLLDVPELVPFRLTPQFLNAMPFKCLEGDFRRLMIQSLESFKENADLLLAAMEVFVFEPAMNWTFHVFKDKEENTDHTENNGWSPRAKVEQCKRKLNGVSPVLITLEDLEMHISKDKVHIKQFEKLILASNMSSLDSQRYFSTTEQVDFLIKQATNPLLLAATYYGWEPWL